MRIRGAMLGKGKKKSLLMTCQDFGMMELEKIRQAHDGQAATRVVSLMWVMTIT
jgi:hypothetical protein